MPIILQVNGRIYDVFTGLGWKNWSRFEVKGRTLALIGGQALSPEDYAAIKLRIK